MVLTDSGSYSLRTKHCRTKENSLQFQDLYNTIKHFAVLVILGAAGPAFTVSPTTTTGTPSNYNFTNVPFDSQTAYFFLDYVDGVIASAFNSPRKTSFLNASSTLLSTVRKQHASNSSYLLITGFSRVAFSPGYPRSHPTTKASKRTPRRTSRSPTLRLLPASSPNSTNFHLSSVASTHPTTRICSHYSIHTV
jgi:hypothetical protein